MRLSLGILLFMASVAVSSCGPGSDPATTPAPNSGATSPAPNPGDAPAIIAPASAGFTDAQADRGRDTFRATCTECHYSSEFADAQFQFKWSRRTAGSLYRMIQTQMPETDPGSLSPEEATEIVSYILRMNGFAAGSSELPADRAVLDGISLASIREN